MEKCPCYRCEERHAGCHAVCTRYKEWAQSKAAENAAIRARKAAKFNEYPANAKSKTHLKHHSEV